VIKETHYFTKRTVQKEIVTLYGHGFYCRLLTECLSISRKIMHLDEVIFIKFQAQCQETVIFQPSNHDCHPKQCTDRSNVLIIFEWISLVKESISGKNGLNGTGWSASRISLKFTIIIISHKYRSQKQERAITYCYIVQSRLGRPRQYAVEIRVNIFCMSRK